MQISASIAAHQLDSFLKNGIIDRDEYKFMRERYAQMDIPDDL